METPKTYAYYDRALFGKFGQEYLSLSDAERAALQTDCHELNNDPGDDADRCYDRFGVVNVLAERIGGLRNLASYVSCLMAHYK